MRIALAVLMLLHGFAHLPGFMASWRLAKFEEMPYHTTVFAGTVDIGDAGTRGVGALWLLLSLAFVASAAGAFTHTPWWTGAALVTALVSAALCIVAWPEARLGLPVNLAILAALLVLS